MVAVVGLLAVSTWVEARGTAPATETMWGMASIAGEPRTMWVACLLTFDLLLLPYPTHSQDSVFSVLQELYRQTENAFFRQMLSVSTIELSCLLAHIQAAAVLPMMPSRLFHYAFMCYCCVTWHFCKRLCKTVSTACYWSVVLHISACGPGPTSRPNLHCLQLSFPM